MHTEHDAPLLQVDGDAEASLDGMDAFHGLLERYWRAAGGRLPCPPDARWRALFDSSVAEIAANIVRHAYRPADRPATFHVSLRCYGDRMEAVLVDNGVPYVLVPMVDPTDMAKSLETLDLEGGWGLPIAHAAADDVEYTRSEDGWNMWRIDKRLSP